MKQIYLYKVFNNLNRCYRTCEFFGIKKLNLIECGNKLFGNLFKSKNNVSIEILNNLPYNKNTIYFETDGDISIFDINLNDYDNYVFGGESNNLPKNKNIKRVYIPKIGNISGLTVESALTIVLYEVMKNEKNRNNNK